MNSITYGFERQQLLRKVRWHRDGKPLYHEPVNWLHPKINNEQEIEEEKIRLLVPTSPKNKDYKDY